MDTNSAIKEMIKRSNTTMAAASRAAGRSDRFIASSLQRSGSMQADTLAAIAAPCGWTVALVPAGSVPAGSIVIDPPASA